MTAINYLSGDRFGRLTAIRRDESAQDALKASGKRPRVMWLCICDCGNEHTVESSCLTTGKTKSCGCLQKEARGSGSITHGMTGTKEYMTWKAINNRCTNKNLKFYKNYGGRGIKVCDRWGSFENFYADMGDSPTPSHSIERIDVNGNYEPINCKWATQIEQANNKNRNKYIEHDGLRLTYSQWGRKIGMKPHTIRRRIEYGYSPKDALNPELVDTTSISRGVTICKMTGRYRSSISYKNKCINLGRFDTKQDAIQARMDAEIHYRGKHDAVNQR